MVMEFTFALEFTFSSQRLINRLIIHTPPKSGMLRIIKCIEMHRKVKKRRFTAVSLLGGVMYVYN